MTFVTLNHIPVPAPDGGVALEARFAGRQRLVDRMPGFRAFEVLRPIVLFAHGAPRGDEYLALTAWAERAAFEAWRTSPEQRPVRPAAHGPLAGGDARAWATMHLAFETAYAPDWAARATAAAAPIAVMNVIDVADEHTALFEDTFRSRQGGVEDQPGFLSLEVLRPEFGAWDGPDDAPAATYVVLSRWESREAHEAWTHSEAFRAAHGRRRLPEGAVLRSGLRAAAIVQPSYAPAAVAAAEVAPGSGPG